MPSPQISISNLNLAVPGNEPAAGQRIGARLTERLSRAPADLPSQRIGALNIRLTLPADASEDAIASLVNEAVINRLRRNRHA